MSEVRELARLVGGQILGSPETVVTAVCGIEQAGPEHVSFAVGDRHRNTALASRAGAVVVGSPIDGGPSCQILVTDPHVAIALIAEHLSQEVSAPAGIAQQAFVDPQAMVDPSATIHPFVVVSQGAHVGARSVLHAGVYLGPDARVGQDTILYPHVVLMRGVRVGDRVILHPGVVLGADGFGYATTQEGKHTKIPQLGSVIVEDDVEIGSNTTIDRARFQDTRICQGTKIDNLVMVAHNVEIGPHSILAGQVGIAGSTKLGHHVTLGGHVGVTGHVTLGDDVQVSAYSGVGQDLPAGQAYMGVPARPIRQGRRIRAVEGRLPQILQRVRELERRLREHLAQDEDEQQ